MKELLHAAQSRVNRPARNLIIDADTRWSSTLHMIDRYYEERDPRAALEPEERKAVHDIKLDPDQYVAIRDIAGVLGPFEAATDKLQGEKARNG